MKDAIAKLLVARYDPVQGVFLRNLIALPMMGAVVMLKIGASDFVSSHLRVHAIRGLLMLAGGYALSKGLEAFGLG